MGNIFYNLIAAWSVVPFALGMALAVLLILLPNRRNRLILGRLSIIAERGQGFSIGMQYLRLDRCYCTYWYAGPLRVAATWHARDCSSVLEP